MPTIRRGETREVRVESDVGATRQRVRVLAVELGFSLIDQTKLVTATSELARNTVVYGEGGQVRIEEVFEGGRTGLRLTFEDSGPGIADVEQALRDGFTTGVGLGLGLGGSRRLMDEFVLQSAPGEGTRVTVVKWK